MPQIKDFDSVISACGGRNIWFTIVIQSYAQLSSVYEQDGAAIIKDNIGTTIFFGSNNRATLEEFSKACGKTYRSDPGHLLNSKKNEPVTQIEEKPLITVSDLSELKECECIIIRMNKNPMRGYILRSYLWKDRNHEKSSMQDYIPTVDMYDDKYKYSNQTQNPPHKNNQHNMHIFDEYYRKKVRDDYDKFSKMSDEKWLLDADERLENMVHTRKFEPNTDYKMVDDMDLMFEQFEKDIEEEEARLIWEEEKAEWGKEDYNFQRDEESRNVANNE